MLLLSHECVGIETWWFIVPFFVYEPALHQVDTKNRRLEALRSREYSNISSLMFGRDPCY